MIEIQVKLDRSLEHEHGAWFGGQSRVHGGPVYDDTRHQSGGGTAGSYVEHTSGEQGGSDESR